MSDAPPPCNNCGSPVAVDLAAQVSQCTVCGLRVDLAATAAAPQFTAEYQARREAAYNALGLAPSANLDDVVIAVAAELEELRADIETPAAEKVCPACGAVGAWRADLQGRRAWRCEMCSHVWR